MTLRREAAVRLRDRGYRGRNGAFALRLDEGFSYVIDVGPLNSRADIHPVVGVQCHAVEDLLTSLLVLPEAPFAATVGANAGYVVEGEYRYFEPPATAAEVLGVIDAGLRILDGYRSLAAIPRGLDEVHAANADPLAGYRRVVVYFLLGDAAGMRGALDRAREEYMRKPSNEIARQFLEFEARLSQIARPQGGLK